MSQFSLSRSLGNLATSAITNSVSNAIFGKKGSGGSSDYSSLAQTFNLGPLGIKNLRYPLDVEARPGLGNQGHYIQFFINQQTRSELEVINKKGYNPTTSGQGFVGYSQKNDRKIQRHVNSVYGGNSSDYFIDGTKHLDVKSLTKNTISNAAALITETANSAVRGAKQEFHDINMNNPRNYRDKSTVYVKRQATKKLNTAISMYMPTGVKSTYGANYQDSTIGQGAAFGANLYTDIMNGKKVMSAIGDAITKDTIPAVTEALILQGLKLAANFPGLEGAADVRGMITGNVVADRLELAFRNIDKRTFEYTFKMLPKSLEEANMVHDIVKAFKKHMSASFKNGNRSGKTLVVPDTFEIMYMYHTGENEYLHKISECVLTKVDVTYGGDRYKTFSKVSGGDKKGAPPVETYMSLSFSELELISRERIEEGY